MLAEMSEEIAPFLTLVIGGAVAFAAIYALKRLGLIYQLFHKVSVKLFCYIEVLSSWLYTQQCSTVSSTVA